MAIEMASMSLRSRMRRKSVTWSSLRPLSFSKSFRRLAEHLLVAIAQRDQMILEAPMWLLPRPLKPIDRHADLAVDIAPGRSAAAPQRLRRRRPPASRTHDEFVWTWKSPLRLRTRPE